MRSKSSLLLAFFISCLAAPHANGQSTSAQSQSSATQSNGIELYGLALGMSGEDVIAALSARNPDATVFGPAVRSSQARKKGGSNYISQWGSSSCFDEHSKCISKVEGHFRPNTGAESIRVIVSFTNLLPPSDSRSIATSIQFDHSAESFGFSIRDFVTEKYGPFEGAISGGRLISPPQFMEYKTYMEFSDRGAKYKIVYRWMGDTQHAMATKKAKDALLSKTDKPF